MPARVVAGVAGAAAALSTLPLAILPWFILDSGISNECAFDGGQPDCYGLGERILMMGWAASALGGLAAIAYVGGAGVYFAFTGRIAPRIRWVVVIGAVLLFIAVLPFVPIILG